MATQPGRLVAMANQVAAFFRPYPPAEAAAGLREHLRANWTAGMLQTLDSAIAGHAPGIDPLVVAALRQPDA